MGYYKGIIGLRAKPAAVSGFLEGFEFRVWGFGI